MDVGVSAQRLLAGAFRLTLAKSMAGFTEQRMEIDANSTETIQHMKECLSPGEQAFLCSPSLAVPQTLHISHQDCSFRCEQGTQC